MPLLDIGMRDGSVNYSLELLLLTCLLCGIVIGIDYWRLKPEMGLGWYALCSVLDDCACEVGVVWGCVKHRTWKPLVPVIKKQV